MTAKSKTPKKTKHGLRIISPDDDLSALFDETDYSAETASCTKYDHKKKKQAQPADSDKAPSCYRDTPANSYDDDNNFKAMLEASLSKMKIEDILSEKHSDLAEESSVIREIIKTYPAPQQRIDLHGCTGQEAARKAGSFIRNASYRGLKTVRIIVGKGIHSAGRAVLPDIIENKMIALKKAQVVLSYCWEKRKKSKSGAMIVYLMQS